MPADLMTLMRQRNISTTMKYYRGREASTVEARLWAARDAELPADGNNRVTPDPETRVFPEESA
jgi:hypothetical protein